MKNPDLSKELKKRIQIVRRDMGGMLFHFTRRVTSQAIKNAKKDIKPLTASDVLNKILAEGKLNGSEVWSQGYPSVSFTEAPIQEFNSIFSLADIASTDEDKPRYEPYGVAVSKEWLFAKGGRPVIYDDESSFKDIPEDQRYRYVPYDPIIGEDYTWEREWRIRQEHLYLDPSHTLVIVPTSEEAFDLVYDHSIDEADSDVEDGESYFSSPYKKPKWLAVSLDLFGFKKMA